MNRRLHRVVHEDLHGYRAEWLARAVAGPDGCTHWVGRRNAFGAPLTRSGEPVLDVAWILAVRDLQPGWYASPTGCGRWWCVNPEHQELHEGLVRRVSYSRSMLTTGQGYARWLLEQGFYSEPGVVLGDLWSYALPRTPEGRDPDELPWWAIVGASGRELDQLTREALGLEPAGPCWER